MKTRLITALVVAASLALAGKAYAFVYLGGLRLRQLDFLLVR